VARSLARHPGDGLILLSACCFASLPIFGRFAYDAGVGWVPLLAWRFVITIAILWGLLLVTGRLTSLPARKVGELVGMGLAFSLMSSLYFTALKFTPVSTLTLLFYLYPALVTLLARLFLKEPLTRVKLLALGLALAGCAIVLRPRDLGDWRGAVLALLATAVYSFYLLAGTRVLQGVDPFLSTGWVMSAATVVFVSAALALGETRLPATLPAWGSVAGMVLIGTILAEVSLFAGLPKTGASRAAILSTLEPLVTLALSAVLLGEEIPPVRHVGGAAILASVFLIHREPSPSGAPRPE
jgi:drug/metabolite transporter (DMT)-like permease